MEKSRETASARWAPLFGGPEAPVAGFLGRVDEGLGKELRTLDAAPAEMVSGLFEPRGKRLRPLLVLLAGRAVGELSDAHVRLGIVIELVHTASLIHDDILDGASVRRSRPTLDRAWGTGRAVLLGDVLFAHALRVAASFPTTEVCRLVAQAVGRTVTGEILQTSRRGDPQVSREDYLRMIELKTGALFEASCFLGARLAGADGAVSADLGAYGRFLGRAYQIYDDFVDVFGDEERAGKSLGTDMALGKVTLPVIVLLEERGEEAGRLREELAGAPTPERRRDWAARLEGADVRRRCLELFGAELRAARSALAGKDRAYRTSDLAALPDLLETAAGRLLARRDGA